MKRTKLFIFDVNTLVSAFIIGSDTNAKAFEKARTTGRIVISRAILSELSDVFLRPEFDRFVRLDDRIEFLGYFERQALLWEGYIPDIRACRDPKDNKFLELAVSCNASCIVTGDNDLLYLNPFRNIPVITAADFLQIVFHTQAEGGSFV